MGVLHSENKGDFRYALSGNYRPGETGSRLTLSVASYEAGLGSMLVFLWLVLSWKQGQKLERLAAIDQVNGG